MEGVSLIDVAAEDDLLIAAGSPLKMPSPGLSGRHELYNCDGLEPDGQQRENLQKICQQIEPIPKLSKSPEQKPGKSGKFNMRKSLAWDSAFFTSEGVLNAEELSIVNSTYGKTEACILPRIQEDLRKSTESTSTLDSESWALENLEVDLFENLRVSIQKSLGKCDKASYNRTDQGELTASRRGSAKKIETSSQNKMKPNIALRRHVLVKQRQDDTSAESLIHVKMNAGVTGDPKLLLKPPRIAPKATALSAIPGKKASVSGSIQTKLNTGKSLSGNAARLQSTAPLKKNVDSSSLTPRTISSSKFTFGSHPSNEVSSVSGSSDSLHKSPMEYSRKRSTRNTYHPCEPATKTLLRPSKSRSATVNTNSTPTCLKSTISLSSSVSPNSSVDSVVSESSSSNSVSMMKPNNLTESFDAGTCSSLSLPVTFGNSIPQPSNLNKLSNEQRGSRTGTSANLSQGLGSTGAKCFKPSGLRMPTPKIGYFDAEKSIVHGSSKISQSGLQSNLPKDKASSLPNTGNSITTGPKKLKPSKLPSVKPAEQSTITNSGSPYTPATRLSSLQSSKPASTPMTLHRLQGSKSAELHDTPIITKDHTLCSKTNMDLSSITRKDGHAKIFVGVSEATEFSQLSNLTEKQVSQLTSKPMTTTQDANGSAFSGEGNFNGSSATESCLTYKKEGTESCPISSTKPMTTTQDANGSAFSGEGNFNGSSATESCLTYKKEGTMVNELHSALQVIQKENLVSTDNNGSLVELIGQRVSSLTLSETKDSSVGDLGSSA